MKETYSDKFVKDIHRAKYMKRLTWDEIWLRLGHKLCLKNLHRRFEDLGLSRRKYSIDTPIF